MYSVKKKVVISAAHKLNLNYPSKCRKLHGHNWVVTVHCRGHNLNADGMIIDFGDIKAEVMKLDHCEINKKVDFNPTAENLARYLCKQIPNCYRVEVEESPDNTAVYESEG